MRAPAFAVSLALLTGQAFAQTPAPTGASPPDGLGGMVERLARVGRSSSPTFSPDGRQVALISDLTGTPQVWVMSAEGGWPRLLTSGNDGLALSGWLYRPPGASGPAPYVLSFHGGPEGQERPSFRGDYQALLSQGIGVFAPNVRGSAGSGKKLVNLDNGELRFAGVRDIEASARYLVQQGIADSRRLGITGGSYGGYMTMAGVTEFPDLFATFFAHSEPWMAAISTVEYGDPASQADLLRRLSPIHELDRVKAARMVQHGANDTNVPVVEAQQIVETLKSRGCRWSTSSSPTRGTAGARCRTGSAR